MKSIDQTVWIGIGESEEAFLKEWNNGNDYVVANTSGSTGIPKEIKLLKKDMHPSAKELPTTVRDMQIVDTALPSFGRLYRREDDDCQSY